ncbi:hypothetical protein [Comamonas terrigena]|uniref:Phage tail protein n=1 Tax=Comamonas terrigena TaxID=32013 RepID=A0A2A7UXZ3_COMTR|nr:hypothetical protein [Comamonas terrigena]PEH90056.1 hypothetical protein CRM82_16970 [Comamonas terrigena]BBL25345.1 hypothetical protein CT3_28000 [Comamonas terrigena NBRC 13299]SUY71077.1 Uncharacterised protein [Comamonas terrigena]
MDFPKSVPGVGLVAGRYVDENQATGQPGTLITAQAVNALTDEILAVIEAAGMVPDEQKNYQLRDAIKAMLNASSPAKRIPRNVLASRVAGMTYTNNTQDDIEVNVAGGAATAQATATLIVEGLEFVGSSQPTQGLNMAITAVVPPGKSYRVPAGKFSAITSWLETSQ